MPSTLARTLLALAGIALLLGGGYTAAAGVEALGTCGTATLVAEPVADETVGAADDPVAFANLTATQQDLARRAIDGNRPTVDSGTWPWSESARLLEYENEYYRLYTVTAECPFPAQAIVVTGALGALLGLGAVVLAGRGLARGE